MRLRPSRRALLVLLPLLGGLAWLGYARADRHARAVGGEGGTGSLACLRCHGDRGGTEEGSTSHSTPWDLEVAPDGRTVYVAATGLSRVLVVDPAAGRVLRELVTAAPPAGIGLSPDGRTLAVALESRHEVQLLATADGAERARLAVGAGPQDACFDGSGQHLLAANGGSGDVSLVDLATGRERRRPCGPEPFVALRAPDGRRLAVVSRRASLGAPERVPASEVTLLDAASGEVLARVLLPACHMSEGAAFTPDGTRLLVPVIVARNLVPILQVARGWVMSSALASVDVTPEGLRAGRVALLPLTEPVRGFADPAGIAVSADGARALVAAGGGDEAVLLDLARLPALEAQQPVAAAQRLDLAVDLLTVRTPLASNPRGVARAGDLYVVSERLNDSLAVLDASGRLVRRIALPGGGDDAVRRGERVFHDGRYAFQNGFSCRSCHPGAHTDGLTYDFEIDGIGRNLLLNRSLRGVAGTDPFKWVGSNPTLERQCGPRFAMVLSRADVFPDEAQRDLVAYLHSLPPPPPDPGAGRLAGADTGAVLRGRALFERHQTKDGRQIPAAGRCITCHPPPHYTSRSKASVGTRTALDDAELLDVPHLTGIGSKAPYLHDGRALTLEEIWTLPGVGDQHGVVTDLSKADLNDLIAFLKGL